MRTPAQLRSLKRWYRELWQPRPELSISQWAEQYRVIEVNASSSPGKMRFDQRPFQREMIDAPLYSSDVCYMIASQLAKTEAINTIVGYFMHHQPRRQLIVYPSQDTADDYAKQKLESMIRATPVLKSIVGSADKTDGRRKSNKLCVKVYPGGSTTVVSGSSAKDLASKSVSSVILDEIDRFPEKLPREGDPVELAEKRTKDFGNAIRIKASTPTQVGRSRIAREYELSDKRRWFVQCPHCRGLQWLKWSQVQWDEGKPETARYICEKPECHKPWSDMERIRAVEGGLWIAEHPNRRRRGYHLSGLYRISGLDHSTYSNYLHQFATEYIIAKSKGREALRVWQNTFLAECWAEEEAEQVEAEPLLKRREDYSIRKIPAWVVRIVCAIDTQKNRWEAEIIGYGPGRETWGLGRLVTSSAPGTKKAEQELDTFISTRFEHPSGDILAIERVFMDAGGDHQNEVYNYCRNPIRSHLVFPCHGSTRPSAPLTNKGRFQPKAQVLLYEVGTHSAKNTIYSRLKLEEHGPGYMHFPMEPVYDAGFFAQLTAEHRVTVETKKGTKSEWQKKTSHARNEALDIRVYAEAAFESLMISNRTLEEDYERMKKLAEERAEEAEKKKESKMKSDTPKPEAKKSKGITRADLEAMKVKKPEPEKQAPVKAAPPAEPGLPTGLPANSRWAKKTSGGVRRSGGGVWRPMLS